MRRVIFACLLSVFGLAASAHAQWTPPLGIPAPPFGLNEVAPATPSPWTTEVPGFYYVDGTNGTDNNGTYGTPAAPRKTIPFTLPAGSVVELHGTYDQSHSAPRGFNCRGTAAQPVFVRGVDAASRPLIRRAWEASGSYCIFENLEFGAFDTSETGKITFLAPLDHAVVRHSELHGNLADGGAGVDSFTPGATSSYVVFWDNSVHDTGNYQAPQDDDAGGIGIGGLTHHIWVIDNILYRNGRDAVTLNQGSGVGHPINGIQYVFIGRNQMYQNRQGGVATKEASDVVISQNVMWGHRPNSGGLGMGVTTLYNPERIWILFNTIYDTERGIGIPGAGSVYVIGNVLYNIHHTTATYDPADLFDAQTGEAIYFRNSLKVFIIANTIFDVDAGIVGTGNHEVHVLNNIIAQKTEPLARHIFLATIPSAEIRNNLIDASPVISWNDPTVYTVSSFQSKFSSMASGNLTGNPLFTNAAAHDFHIAANSPARDKGLASAVYATFKSLYNVDLDRDAGGGLRPLGAYDIGAFEGTGAVVNGPAEAPTGVRVSRD